MTDILRVNRNVSLSTDERKMLRTLGQGVGRQTLTVYGIEGVKEWRETAGELVDKGLAEEVDPSTFRITARGRRILRIGALLASGD